MQVKKALQTCPLSLSLKHTYTHINLSKQPPVFITISKSKDSAASVFGNSQTTSALAQWNESLCGVGHHQCLLHGKRRRIVEETLQHFGGELHKRGDGRLAGGGHWRLLSQLSEGLHRDSDLGQVGLLEGQVPKLDLPISLAATCMNGGKSYRRGQPSQSMLRPTGWRCWNKTLQLGLACMCVHAGMSMCV